MNVSSQGMSKHQTQKQPKNQFIITSTQNPSQNPQSPSTNPQTHPIQDLKPSLMESLNLKSQQITSLQQQNLSLSTKNKQLMKQLQTFSKKLDQQINKRVSESQQRKPKLSLEEKQSIKVQNLYKKIEIYKKEVALLKGKVGGDEEGRLGEYESRIRLFIKENQEMRDEIKLLKKIIKKQEKGLVDIGAEGFLKIVEESEKNKEEVRKLRLEIDQIQRKHRVGGIGQAMTHSRVKAKTPHHSQHTDPSPFQRLSTKHQLSTPTNNHLLTNHRTKKIFSDMRLKTEPSHLDIKTQQNQSELNLNFPNDNKPHIHHERLQKYESKIRIMNAEKIRQREIIENLKIQIVQKDKEVNYLREKVGELRRLANGRKGKFLGGRGQMQQEQLKGYQERRYNMQAIEQVPSRSHSNLTTNDQDTSSSYQHQKKANYQRCPRLQEKGQKLQSSHKWNHFQFSSKIKALHVLFTPTGIIHHIHASYEKGSPSTSELSELHTKNIQSFVCSQSDQFISQIKGWFDKSRRHLKGLVVKTNHKRVMELGHVLGESECDNFVFNIHQEEFPSALFGENDSEGVVRIGCFVDRLVTL